MPEIYTTKRQRSKQYARAASLVKFAFQAPMFSGAEKWRWAVVKEYNRAHKLRGHFLAGRRSPGSEEP